MKSIIEFLAERSELEHSPAVLEFDFGGSRRLCWPTNSLPRQGDLP